MNRIDEGECRVNLSKEELIKRYVEPYLQGDAIITNGSVINPKELWRVKITESEHPLDEIIRRIDIADQRDRSPMNVFLPSAEWRAIDEVKNVTDQYINMAPGSLKKSVDSPSKNQNDPEISNKVFIVHGHDLELKNDVELFLRSINLEPIVLHRQLDEGLTVIEKFEKYSDVNYALILLTPDDIGYSIQEAPKPENERKIELRARQNVIFEFGFFVGKLTRRNVCCIYKSGVTLPSDLNGLIYKQVNKTVEEVGVFLMKEMKNAGIRVKFE